MTKMNMKQIVEGELQERLDLTENNHLTMSMYMVLACDENDDVRYALASNANIPRFVLDRLSEDENVYVACRAEQSLERIEMEAVKVKMSIMHYGHVACISPNCAGF